MDGLLNALSGAESWVWLWLSSQYRKGQSKIIKIGQGLAPGLYSRKQLTRILRGLEVKKLLIIDHLPGNQHQELVVVIDESRCLDMVVQAERQECLGEGQEVVYPPNLRFARTIASRQKKPGEGGGVKVSGVCRDIGGQAGPQLSLSSRQKDLKALVEMGQEELIKAVINLSLEEFMEIQQSTLGLAPWAKGKFSERAKLYAVIRYLQSGKEQAQSGVAWVTGVAKRAHYQMAQIGRGAVSGPGGNAAFVPPGLRRGAGL